MCLLQPDDCLPVASSEPGWQEQHGFNPRVAFRHARGLTQQQVADRWNERWPSDKDAPKTGKHLAYWEAWPGETGRAPSVETLNRLAFIYQCGAADLLEGENYSHLDTAIGGSDESQAAAVEPADNSAGGELIVKSPDMPLAVAGQTDAEAASPVMALTSALASREVDYNTLVHLLRVMAYHMKRRDFLHQISRAAGVAAATPLVGALDPDERDRMVGIIRDPSRVDASAIDNVRTILWACRRQDNAFGPQAALETILAQTRLTEIMLAEGTRVSLHQNFCRCWLN
jgi:transcriptional regulator with XRE-family HTH domain